MAMLSHHAESRTSVGEKPGVALVADDDPDDRFLIQMACIENGFPHALTFVEDGEALMDYLLRRKVFAETGASTRPKLILLDLYLPKKDGQEVLREIREDEELKDIPIVVMTTSDSEEIRERCLSLGARGYFTKPNSSEGLMRLMKKIESICLP